MIPYSRPKRSDYIPCARVPCTAAHTYIAHIWQNSLPGQRPHENKGRFPFDQIFRFEIPGIPCDEWNSNFPVSSINQSQAIGFQVSRENKRSNERLFYLCLLALGLLNDSEVKINDVLGEGDTIPFIVRI